MKRIVLWLGLMLLIPFIGLGQRMQQYDEDFQFRDGIYLSFEDFKNNNVIPPTHILSDLDIRNPNYLLHVLEHDSLIYYDNFFEERKVLCDNVWGFSKAGKPHVAHNLVRTKKDEVKDIEYFPINMIGAICYYTAMEYVYRGLLDSPSIGIFSGPYYTDLEVQRDKVSVIIVLDFKTGKTDLLAMGEVTLLDAEKLYPLLESDVSLLKEFAGLPLREQRKQAIVYIQRFNKRNPIFFPVN